MKISGLGVNSIAKLLNQQDPPPAWLPTRGWQFSTINKILHNPSVIGIFQPQTKENGKRTPVGAPIEGYYPRIISEEKYYYVQEVFKQSSLHGGSNGKVLNLFGYIAKCGYCGASMVFINKGKKPKGGQYLVCDYARRGVGCDYISLRYNDFENKILDHLIRLGQKRLVDLKNQNTFPASKEAFELQQTNKSIEAIDLKINNMTESIECTNDSRVIKLLVNKLSKLMAQKESIVDEQQCLQKILDERRKAKEYEDGPDLDALCNVERLINDMGDKVCEGIDVGRSKLRNQIKLMIEQITVFPKRLKGGGVGTQTRCAAQPAVANIRDDKVTCFSIKFKGGQVHDLRLDSK